MMPRFKQYTPTEVEQYISSFVFTREIKEIHFHHTWKPTIKNYMDNPDKERVIWGMWNYHVNTLKWSDIAQHFSIAPDGTLWGGRDLNKTPASISGRNTGAICLEHIGNFDVGNDKLDGVQLEASIRLIVALIKRAEQLQGYRPIVVFHNEYSSKTCPGTSVKKDFIVNLVNERLNPVKRGGTMAYGIVTATSLNVRTSPMTGSSNKIGELAKDTEVKIQGQNGAWYQIDYNGQVGWVHGNYVKLIEKEICPFNDIESDRWSYNDIVEAYNLGLVSGAKDNLFSPTDTLTREQGVALLMRLYRLLKD